MCFGLKVDPNSRSSPRAVKYYLKLFSNNVTEPKRFLSPTRASGTFPQTFHCHIQALHWFLFSLVVLWRTTFPFETQPICVKCTYSEATCICNFHLNKKHFHFNRLPKTRSEVLSLLERRPLPVSNPAFCRMVYSQTNLGTNLECTIIFLCFIEPGAWTNHEIQKVLSPLFRHQI